MKKPSILGIIGIIFAICSISFFIASFLIRSNVGLIVFIIALIFSIISIIFGATSYWGKYRDKLGLADFIIGLVVVVIWIVTAIFIYMSMSAAPMYGTPPHRPKVK